VPKLLTTAIHNQRWDVAAHALVLAAVQTQINESQNEQKKKGRTARQPKRS
jgi:hypothetical protein